MTTFLIIAGVLVFWFVLTTLVRFERGWVGMTPRHLLTIRITVAWMRQMEALFEALTPIFVKTTKAIAEWGAEYERVLNWEIRKMVAQARDEGVFAVPILEEVEADDLELIRYAVSRYVLGVGPGDAPEEYAAVVRAMENEQAAA